MADESPVIAVIGDGVVIGVPDLCVVTIGLTALAEQPVAALEQIAATAAAVTDRIREEPGLATDVQTLNVSIQDFFDHQQQRVTGQAASYVLSVKVGAIDQVGPLLAAIGAVAGDALRVQGIQLGLADPGPLREVARRQAVHDAQIRAAQLADAAGVALGPVLSIEELSGAQPWAFRRAAGAAGAPTPQGLPMPPVPVEPGSLLVAVRVAVTYQIAR